MCGRARGGRIPRGCGAGQNKPAADASPRTPAEALAGAVRRLGSVTSYQASVSISRVVAGRTCQPDPLLHARMFTASKDVHLVGRETIGGTSTIRYQGTFELGAGL